MSALNTYWRGENIKMVLHLGSNTYTSYMYNDPNSQISNTDKFILSINIDDSDGNCNVNPLGIMSSDRVTITCYDKDYTLSPANDTNDVLTNGQKLELFIQNKDNDTWERFGIYYTTSFSDTYSDGSHGLTTIIAEDKINILGNTEVPELETYAGTTALQLIQSIFTAIGLTVNDYAIDSAVDLSYIWGVLPGTKLRDFLNSVLQRAQARIIIDDAGVIRIIKATSLPTNYNTLTLDDNNIGELKNLNSSNINFDKISVSYYEAGKNKKKILYNETGLNFAANTNVVHKINFSELVVSVENVVIEYKSPSNGGNINNFEYEAFQDGMVIKFNTGGAEWTECDIYVEGRTASDTKEKETISINTNGRIGLQEYNFDPKIQMTQSQANTLCYNIKNYMDMIKNKVSIHNSMLTPYLSVGDKVVLNVTNSVYAGNYMVTAINLSIGEDYKSEITLMRLS